MEEAIASNEELCQYLLEQDDEHMDIECEQPENGDCDSSTSQNIAPVMESEPMERPG